MVIFDRGSAARLLADFQRDLESSKRLELKEWRSRPPLERTREKFWAFFGEIF